MIDTGRLIAYIRRKVLAYGMALLLLLILSALAVVLSRLPNLRWPPDSWLLDMGLPILLGMIPGAVALLVARRIAGRFVYALYELGSISEGESCVNTQMFGSAGGPYLVAKEGQIATGSNAIKNIGGPGAVVLYNDSAIVLEQAGRLTRVKRGSGVVRLEPFERVWNTLSILPQRWSFDVTAITQDGIPITYPADIHFQIGDTDEDIFKAATSTWIRDANRTEPDRLMTWDKRIIIGYTEGVLRSILALYTLDQLIDAEQREAVRAELETRLQRAVPNVGAKILQVNLGDIKMQDKEPVPLQQWIQEQWIQAWQVKHDSDITIRLAEGMARGTELEEQARLEIHTDRLDHTTRIMEELARSGAHVPHFILLSLVERIERMRYERGYFLPENLLHLLGSLHAALYPNLVANLPPEPPSASTPTAPT